MNSAVDSGQDQCKSPRSVPSLLDGFASADSAGIIQKNVYIILGHGWFQRWVLLCTFVSLTVLLMHAFAYSIVGRPLDHWCQPPEALRHMDVQEWRNMAIPILADGSFSKCTVYDPPLPEEDEEKRREVPCNRWDYDSEDRNDSIVSSWDLVCGRLWLYSISSSVYMLGSLTFVPLAGIAADRVGRRPTISACALGMLLATLAAGSSQSFQVFLAARFVISATSSATFLLVFILLYELTGNANRPLYSLLAASVGSVLAQLLLFALLALQPRWFLAQAFFAAATALVAIWCLSLNESPVWLLDTWRVRLAESSALQAAAVNGVDMTKARATFRELIKMLGKREQVSTGASTGGESKLNAVIFRRRAASALASWFGVSFAFYGTGLRQATLPAPWAVLGFLLQALLFFAAYYCINKRGQRAALSGVLTALCLCSALRTATLQLGLSAEAPMSRMVVDSTSAVAMALNFSYTAEVYPTMVRSLGLCISYSVGRA
ncbi:hypothetical protein V5799_021180, partial [Amblyomma americanum]